MLNVISTATTPYGNQQPGTSGLRKKTKVFMQTNYVANYIQSICNALQLTNTSVLLGGDGRFYNDIALQQAISILVANNVKHIYIPLNGVISTPACSNFIIQNQLNYGILATASHNKGGIDYDFGIKVNNSHGAPLTDEDNKKIVQHTASINNILSVNNSAINLNACNTYTVNSTTITVFNPTKLYTQTLKQIFNFNAIKQMFNNGFKFSFNAVNGTTGIFAYDIFVNEMGLPASMLTNIQSKPDFGGLTPDPNPTTMQGFIKQTLQNNIDFGCCCDSDGDRNFIFTNKYNLTASDELALITKYSHTVPYFSNIKGVARSFATPPTVDAVAKDKGLNTYVTPVGWKFFSSLLSSGKVDLCGEESFGIGGKYIQEKDGLFAIMFILHIQATTGLSLNQLLQDLWEQYGKWFFTRLDYENILESTANTLIANIQSNAQKYNFSANQFNYTNPVTNAQTNNCGLVVNINAHNSIVVRYSGTGTQNATIRIYLHSYSNNYNNNTLPSLLNTLQQLIGIDIQPTFTV